MSDDRDSFVTVISDAGGSPSGVVDPPDSFVTVISDPDGPPSS